MIFLWDIFLWLYNELLAGDLQDDTGMNQSLMQVFLANLVDLYNTFTSARIAAMQAVNSNSQVIVLQNTLNDLFDPVNRNILVLDEFNGLTQVFTYESVENDPLYIYTDAEYQANVHLPKVYLFENSEYGTIYHFIVQAHVGSLTAAQIIQLKADVEKWRCPGKIPYYRYDDLTPF